MYFPIITLLIIGCSWRARLKNLFLDSESFWRRILQMNTFVVTLSMPYVTYTVLWDNWYQKVNDRPYICFPSFILYGIEHFCCSTSSSTSPLFITERVSEIPYSTEKHLRKWWKLRSPGPHYPWWDNADHYVKLGEIIPTNPAKMIAIFSPIFSFVLDA